VSRAELTTKERNAVAALLTHASVDDAAKAAGVGCSTLWRWLRREDFRGAVSDAQQEAFRGAIGRLQGLASEAVEALRKNLKCGAAAVEVRAADILLARAVHWLEVVQLDERMRRLEKLLAGDEPERGHSGG